MLQGSRPMNQSVKYWQNAAVCYEAVRILTDPRQKDYLLAMARSWISLADHAQRTFASQCSVRLKATLAKSKPVPRNGARP
jgi:hypothetical protein